MDLYEYCQTLKEKKYNVYGLSLFPQFCSHIISKEINEREIQVFDMIIASKCLIKNNRNYNEFINNQECILGITVGKESNGELHESSMWVIASGDIDSDFRSYFNKVKKNMNKGAWVINPNNDKKTYYKNHMYTDNAKYAYKQGVKLRPIAGWNFYELSDDLVQ